MRPARSDKATGCDACPLAKVVPDSPADVATLGLVTDVRAMASLALISAGSNRDLQDFALDIINRLRGAVMVEPATIAEYVTASDQALDETLTIVRGIVADVGPGPASVFLRAVYEQMTACDPSRAAGLLSHALVRLADRRP